MTNTSTSIINNTNKNNMEAPEVSAGVKCGTWKQKGEWFYVSNVKFN